MLQGSPLRKAAIILGLSMLPIYWVLLRATPPSKDTIPLSPTNQSQAPVAEEEK